MPPDRLTLYQQHLPRHLQPYAQQIEGQNAMTPAPDEPMHISEQRAFGEDVGRHYITGRPVENGSGALHPDEQAVGHLGQMEYELAELNRRRASASDQQKAALNTEHDAMKANIAHVRTRLTNAGIFDRFGERAANRWRLEIVQRGL